MSIPNIAPVVAPNGVYPSPGLSGHPYNGSYVAQNGRLVRFHGLYDVDYTGNPMAQGDRFTPQQPPQIYYLPAPAAQAPPPRPGGGFKRLVGNLLLIGAGIVLLKRINHNYGSIWDFAKSLTGNTSKAVGSVVGGVGGGLKGALKSLRDIFKPVVQDAAQAGQRLV
jgi:hypothetical protein